MKKSTKVTVASVALSAMAAVFAAQVSAASMADVVSLSKYLIGQGRLADAAAADLNGDGMINAIDLTLMKRAAVSGTDEPAETTAAPAETTPPEETAAPAETTTTPTEPVVADDSYVSQITFGAGSVTLKNANDQVVAAADAQNVQVDGTKVKIVKPTSDGTNDFGDINVDGECTEGQIYVDVDETAYATGQVTLNLRGLKLSNSSDSPIYVNQIADECVITVKNGTENTISDGTSYQNADQSAAAIYSLDDLKFKGKGTLTVNGNCGDGIVSKDDIKIWNGNIQVTAVDDGIRGKDSIRIGDPDATDYSSLTLDVTSKSGDGLKSTNDTADSGKGYIRINGGTVKIKAEQGDGIQAEQAVEINGGDIDIYTYQGSSTSSATGGQGNPWGGNTSTNLDISAKGIKAVGLYDEAGTTYQSGGTLTVNGGMITVNSTDDCLHCAGDAVLNAGKLKLSTNDDAVHSDNDLYVGGTTAGTDYTSLEVYVTACYEGFEAVKIYQNNGNIYIISRDDGYNAAGGADSSGNGNNTGWNQGGWGFPGGGMGGSYGEMHLNGGIVSVNTSFQDADGFDSNGPVIFNGGYYFGNGGDSFDSGDGYSITYNGGYAFGGLGMNGGSGYNMSTQMLFATSDGTVIASSMTGGNLTYAYGDANVKAYSGAEVTGGENISTLGQPAIYISGKVSGGTEKTLSQGSSSQQPGGPGGWG